MFRVFFESIPGPYHTQNAIPNQDFVTFLSDEKLLVAAVADGAGSLSKSHLGSEIVARTAVKTMWELRSELPLSELVEKGMNAARSAILSEDDFEEMGSTLTVAVIDLSGGWAVGSVGDSFAILHKKDSHSLVTAGGFGEYANITQLITSNDLGPVYESGFDAVAISLSSDGLESVGLLGDSAHEGFWNTIRDSAISGSLDISKLFRWLQSMDKIVDDTTLLTAVRPQ